MKPLLISQSDTDGGAARAAFRLHRALLQSGVQSRLRVGEKKSDLASVIGPRGAFGKALALARPLLSRQVMRLQKSPNPILHSPALLPSGLVAELNRSDADVLNLQWVNNEFLSIADIGALRKPLVWTLHDMWAFSGAEHYGPDGADARWRRGYPAGTRPPGHRGVDLDRRTWNRKARAWGTPIPIVAPSRWLAECVSSSALMHEWPVTVIPYPLDTRQYQPWPKALARELLGLPASAPLVLFGAIGGCKDPRKGWDLLQPALALTAKALPGAVGVISGQSEPAVPPRLGLPLHWMGHLHDDATLALLYSAADVMVVPSLQDNLPQSGTEAQACGCPVVGFRATGLPDVLEHGQTGYLAQAYSSEDLAQGIAWVLADTGRHNRLSAQARERAVRLWSPAVVVPQYLDVYRAAVARKGSPVKTVAG